MTSARRSDVFACGICGCEKIRITVCKPMKVHHKGRTRWGQCSKCLARLKEVSIRRGDSIEHTATWTPLDYTQTESSKRWPERR